MKKTICDKCGADTDGRNNNFSERIVNNTKDGTVYIDLCPNCVGDFDKVRAAATRTYNATMDAYLSCLVSQHTPKSTDSKEETDV